MNMEQIWHHLLMYLNCVFEIYLLYNFLKALFPVCKDRKWMMRLKAFGCITAIFMINQLRMPIVNTVCVPIIYLFYVWLNFQLHIKKSLPYCLFYYLILAISEVAFMYVYPIIGVNVNKINIERVMLLILQDILRFIIIQLIKQKHYIPYDNSSYKYTKSLYMLPLATMILINGFVAFEEYPYGDILVSLGSILLIVSNINIFSVVEKLIYTQNVIKDNEMLVLKSGLERQHYQRMEEVNEECRSYIHDMRHVLKTIGCLAERDNTEEIKRLSLETMKLLSVKSLQERKNYIGDTITDAILGEREKAAKERGVRFEIEVKKGTDLGFISELDKIRMFGNLLDNALESAAACDEGYISLQLRQGNDALIILQVKNNFRHDNIKKGKFYHTIKADEARHGFGIRNVEELASKYNGLLKITEEGHTFMVTLILSNIQKPEKS